MGSKSGELDKNLNRIDVWAISFGCMVGWGVFAMPGNTFLTVAGPMGTMIALTIGMLIVLIVGNNFSYLMGRSSLPGGIYSYTKEAFGRDHAFISSWFLCLSYLTIVFLNGTALFYIIRILMDDNLRLGLKYNIGGNEMYTGETILSIVVLVGVGLLLVFAKPLLQKINTILAVLLIIGVVIITVICIPYAIGNGNILDFGAGGISKGYSIFSIVILAPWAFVGFEVISFDTANYSFAIKKSRVLVAASIIAAAFSYISMTVISVAVVPDGYNSWQEYIGDLNSLKGVISVPTFYVAGTILGRAGLIIMTITAVSAILTGIIGGYRATTKVLAVMAEDRILSDKFLNTSYSIFIIMIISILLAFLGRNTLNWFVDLTAFGAIVGFGYTSAAAWKIAKTESDKRVEITGLLGIIISIIFVVVQLVPNLTSMEAMGSEAFLMLAIWCLIGFVFYWRTVNHSTLTEYSGISVSGIVLFALLIYSALLWFAKMLMAQQTIDEVRSRIVYCGIILLIIVFIGLLIMIYVQALVRKKHEDAEREKIRAVEGSLAKSQFLFNMSHDIRTPMNAIIGYTNLALQEPSSPKLHDYLEKIDLSSQHLLALINDILEMSRIESGKVELEYTPTDLNLLLSGIKDLFSEQMKQKEMNFTMHTSQITNPYVWCDKKNLNRVLLNIISNSYKFTPSGGEVSVTVWEIDNSDKDYGSYEIRIRDSGIGMSKDFVERMFNAFERERTSTDSGIEGTGLGLSITKSIIDLMGGTIEVLTAPGNGTEMIIRLKLKLARQEEIVDESKVEDEDTIVDFTGKRVLLVEDNQINMEIASMILTQMGFQVEEAENGKIAVDMVAESEPGYYDGVLMDIQMPVMDGYTATREIRKLENSELASIPIIAMTANAFAEDVKESERAGMQGHIAKPIDINVMIATLSSIL